MSTQCVIPSSCTSLIASWNASEFMMGQLTCNTSASAGSGTASDGTSYSQPLHIAGVFIILACSALGPAMPLLSKYHPMLAVDPWYYILGKSAGIGVVLACGFVHMLQPGAQSLVDPSLPYEFNTDYQAYAYLFAMLAILAMHAMDLSVIHLSKVLILSKVMEVREKKQKKQQEEEEEKKKKVETGLEGMNERGKTSQDSEEKRRLSENNVVLFHDEPTPRKSVDDVDQGHGHGHNHSYGSTESSDVMNKLKGLLHGAHSHGPSGQGGHADDEVHSLLMLANELPAEYSYLLRFGMLEFGLTVHSIIIGLTTGIVADTELKTLLIALSFHQFFEGLALGARLAMANLASAWHAALFVIIFAVSAPVGMALGVGITSGLSTATSGPTFLLTQGTFDSVCGGILIYLGVTLLTRDFKEDMDRVCTGRSYEWLWRAGLFAGLYSGAGFMAFIGKYL